MTTTQIIEEPLPELQLWDAIVIGGSAAGLSAALTLGRAHRSVLVIDQQRPRNRFADHMHGVLGLEGVAPAELVRRGREEAALYGAKFLFAEVTDVADSTDEEQPGLRIMLEDGRTILTRAVIAAGGLTDHLPAVPGLAERWGKQRRRRRADSGHAAAAAGPRRRRRILPCSPSPRRGNQHHSG
ncbi:NAD(P)/FAD-dependent oxidoreductase [Nesterenkonia massiliensis]|uniref:NAD(P)/FAD-dependent oxidoreductase n=1 Tax=Nesterenkonia massiliensis TaxID=1232429 RepID=UPI0004284BF0|nr:NAD(P)/FAD-dependent oxidoreductase [Nesterenkonia massiliensis]